MDIIDIIWFITDLIVKIFMLAGIGMLLVVVAYGAGSNRPIINKLFSLLFEFDDFDADEEDLII